MKDERSMETILSINLIATNPDVRGGRPVIAGTGVCVSDLVIAMLFHQRNPDELASDFALSLAQVYAALAYYYEHKAEVDEELRQRRIKDTELKDKHIGSRHSLLSG
jgi:uncharacterized protein (DUF433 family)